MKNRIITSMAMSAVLAVSCCVGASANTAVYGNIDAHGSINVSLTTDAGKSLYGVHILKPDAAPENLAHIDTTTDFAGFETMSVSEGSKYQNTQMTFKLPADSDEGVYTLVIGGGELKGKIIKLAYNNEYASAASEVKNTDDVEAVLVKYQDKAWSLDFECDAYKNYKSLVIANIKSILAAMEASNENVTTAFNRACVLAELKNCPLDSIADNLLMYENVLGLSYADVVYEDEDAIAESFKNLRADTDINTTDDVTRLIKATNAVRLLNNATRDDVLTVLKDNNDVFELDFDGDFKKLDPYDVAKEMVAGDTPYTSLKQIKDRFDTAIVKILEDDEGTSNTQTNNKTPSKRGSPSVSVSSEYVQTVVTPEDIASLDIKEIFNDLDSAQWAVPYIKYLYENGIMSGDGLGNFRPADGILREEFLKLIIEALDIELVNEAGANFGDVPDWAWYASYVKTGVELGIVNGMDDSVFGVGNYISRQDAAVMLMRACEVTNTLLEETAEEIEFTDAEDISEYASDAVSLLTKSQILSGYEDGSFAPKKSILRSEAAKIIYSAIKSMKR